MGLFDKTDKLRKMGDKLLNLATTIDNKEAEKVLSQIIIEGENIKYSYKGLRDLLIFTDKRIIKVDIQGITGKKREFLSIPYKSISRFSVETAGTFDLDAELKIYGSSGLMAAFEFGKSSPIFEVQNHLAEIIL